MLRKYLYFHITYTVANSKRINTARWRNVTMFYLCNIVNKVFAFQESSVRHVPL